jgi:hypothetical protein
MPKLSIGYLILLSLCLTQCSEDRGTGPSPSLGVVTREVTGVSFRGAKCGGAVIGRGGSTVVDRGVCWSTMPSPTVDNERTFDGSDDGFFSSSLTGLLRGTNYYVRAYASNGAEMFCWQEMNFVTEDSLIFSAGDSTFTGIKITGHLTFLDHGVPRASSTCCSRLTTTPTLFLAGSRSAIQRGIGT